MNKVVLTALGYIPLRYVSTSTDLLNHCTFLPSFIAFNPPDCFQYEASLFVLAEKDVRWFT